MFLKKYKDDVSLVFSGIFKNKALIFGYNSSTLAKFKERIKFWNGNICRCRLWKTFMPAVGFL